MNLAVSDPGADVGADADRLAAEALEHGATGVLVVAAGDIVLGPADPHEGAACGCPGNLMSPPFSPDAAEFAGWLGRFDVALLVEVEAGWSGAAWEQGTPGWRCRWRELRADPDRWATAQPTWRRLHDLTMRLEREAMRRGYYLSVGFGAADCELCEVCDTTQLCVEPYAARPSMEAVGIDVRRTREAAGWPAPRADRLTLTGVLLLV